jgi:hypothetical protein
MSTYSLRSRGRSRPQGQAYFPPCTRGGFLRASCPVAHVQLVYSDACTCAHHRLSLSTHQRVPISRHNMAADAPDKGCNHAQKGSPVPPHGLVYTTYGWVRGIRAASGRSRAGSVCIVCSGTVPTLGCIAARLHIDNWLTLGPYKSDDTVVSHLLLLVRVGGGVSRPCACTA